MKEDQKEHEKGQEKHQEDLEKESKKVEGKDEYRDILSHVIHEGEEVFKINNKAMTLSAIIAGLEIGFSYFLICTLHYLLADKVGENFLYKLFSVVYPVGFIVVILFTLFIGALAPQLHLFTHETMVTIGTHVLDYDAWILFLSAIVAGWLMGLLNWLLNSTTNSISRIFLIFMITGVIGFGGFHHSIVGNIEVFGAYIHSNSITLLDYVKFLALTLIGNGIGGAVVVGLFKYRIFESNYTK